MNEDVRELMHSFPDPLYCSIKDRNTFQKCCTAMDSGERKLKMSYDGRTLDFNYEYDKRYNTLGWRRITVKGGSVVGVDCRGEDLSCAIPTALMNLYALQTLDLGSNRLDTISSVLFTLT